MYSYYVFHPIHEIVRWYIYVFIYVMLISFSFVRNLRSTPSASLKKAERNRSNRELEEVRRRLDSIRTEKTDKDSVGSDVEEDDDIRIV